MNLVFATSVPKDELHSNMIQSMARQNSMEARTHVSEHLKLTGRRQTPVSQS